MYMDQLEVFLQYSWQHDDYLDQVASVEVVRRAQIQDVY